MSVVANSQLDQGKQANDEDQEIKQRLLFDLFVKEIGVSIVGPV
eukprot:CAMPEP_0116874596 /NCGR_PEP_ID=MMETSP0463-20121206/6072_1 /TAXON_ID=181622 /ORGANISM="Strombidinopsis sp, Strain SopsisLIS2011" /LENGTH=43 /DNA_ID= /DNA_START= /DNA_END= /DNA_ORIENTATION=